MEVISNTSNDTLQNAYDEYWVSLLIDQMTDLKMRKMSNECH